MKRARLLLCLGALLAAAACEKSAGNPPTGPAPTPATTPSAPTTDATIGGAAPIVASYAARARTIAAEYQSWGRVDDELRWAPWLCRLPRPAVARVSTSEHVETHGRKLYSVFAKNRAAYPQGPHAEQAVVKESWTPETADVAYDPEAFRASGPDHFYPYAKKDGVVYHAKERAGLYMMWKLAEPTPDSDAGWVYATVTAAGEVTGAGRIAACMECHHHASNERFFGLPPM